MKDYYMTVGQLRKAIADLPDDAEVWYERIEDVYFTDHHWTTLEKQSHCYSELPEERSYFIRCFGSIRYKDDKNLYLTAHY